MAVPATAVTFAVVGVTAVVLFVIGTPGHRGGTTSTEPPDRMASELATAAPSGPAVATASADSVTLRSVSFELPTSDRTFPVVRR